MEVVREEVEAMEEVADLEATVVLAVATDLMVD